MQANHSKNQATVALYHTHEEAEEAVKSLERSGFDLQKLSIVGRDYHTEECAVGYYNTGERMMAWGKTGAFWGSIWGMLFGSAFFLVPGIGPLFVAGPLVSAIAGALEGAAVMASLGAIGAGLYSLGIPRDSIVAYEAAIKAGKFLVVAQATPEAVAAILRKGRHCTSA